MNVFYTCLKQDDTLMHRSVFL